MFFDAYKGIEEGDEALMKAVFPGRSGSSPEYFLKVYRDFFATTISNNTFFR